MSMESLWLKRVLRDTKGIWGIECPAGREFESDFLRKPASSKCELRVIKIDRIDGVLAFFEDGQQLSFGLDQILSLFIKDALEELRNSLCLVIEGFHNANVDEQCAIVRIARAIQESTTLIACQVVLVGRWGYFAFRAKYRELHGHTSSPPLESKNILFVPPWSVSDVTKLLFEQRIIGAENSNFERVAIDFLVEQTAGDEFLIRHVVEDLSEKSGDWKENLEHILSELVSSATVVSEINCRIRLLGPEALTELKKILRVHRMIRGYESTAAEELWLSGLVILSKLDGTRNYSHMAGPLINTVTRNILLGQDVSVVADPKNLCFDRHTISVAAYENVAIIENMLRNLVVSLWHAELGDAWINNLATTKTSSRLWENEESLARNLMIIVKSELAASGIIEKDAISQTSDVNNGNRQVTVFESAREWQNRQHVHHGVDLASTSIMHFLTTESLEAVLCNKKTGLQGEGKIFKKEALVSILEEYRAVRSAIAHNQPVKLNTVLRLEEMIRKIVEWNTVFVDRTLNDAT
jgi:hypothetical protein